MKNYFLTFSLLFCLISACAGNDDDDDNDQAAADDDSAALDDDSTAPSADDDATDDDAIDDDTTTAPPEAKLEPISPNDLAAALEDKDFLLINVHVPYSGEIGGTDTHIAYTEIDELVAYIGPDLGSKVVLYCLSNMMSMSAGNELVDRGYYAVKYLDGGMSAWEAAGYELIKE
jgi:rhodanese-related sulfurtransferase